VITCALEVPSRFRFNLGESMMTLNKGANVVISQGQQAFQRKADRLPQFTMTPCCSPDGTAPCRCDHAQLPEGTTRVRALVESLPNHDVAQ
jgi:hypothetical protein